MSSEEAKIRSELVMDIEKELEQEIIDGIYHLALKLHRLYQQQKERNDHKKSELGAKNRKDRSNKVLSEVNINIKLEGGTKIEIKESKKEVPGRLQTAKSPSSDQNVFVYGINKKFDWEKSLRSGDSDYNFTATTAEKKNEGSSHQGNKILIQRCPLTNASLENVRKYFTSPARQRKGNVNSDSNKGWKY